jgi:lactate permease
MPWHQVYDPLGSPLLSALVAALPVAVLLGTLAFLRLKAHRAALLGLGAALVVAIGVFGMPPAKALAAAVYGAAFGLFPIGWIIVNVIFLYDLSREKGHFSLLQQSLTGITRDRRLQLLLVAFSFGAFFEGAAGFGTPVAVTAAILIGLGFAPLAASGLSLIANTSPVAFGALGTPIVALAGVTGLDIHKLSAMVGRQLSPFSLVIPFWLVWAFAGFRGMLEVWPALLVAGACFALPQVLISNLHGPWLAGILPAVVSMAALVFFLKLWRPKRDWDGDAMTAESAKSAGAANAGDTAGGAGDSGGAGGAAAGAEGDADAVSVADAGAQPGADADTAGDKNARAAGATEDPDASTAGTEGKAAPPRRPLSRGEVFKAWLPWALLTLAVFVWGIPQVKRFLDSVSSFRLTVPVVDGLIYRMPPVVPAPAAEPAVYVFNWLSFTGTAILLAAVTSALAMGFKPRRMAALWGRTAARVRFSLLTVAAMMAVGYVTRYAGLDAAMGLAFARTGFLYPFFGTLLGWLGVALTGSDTSSNVLFGSLQRITAEQLGLNPVLMAAANSSGGVMGKMIDAQSIVVASTATRWYGHEGDILRFVFLHSLALAALVGLLVILQAYVLPFASMVVK